MDYTKRPGKKIEKIGEVINKEKPTISIVTPFYNGGETLMETANCIFSQTYPFFEWIIVDDGSKDKASLKELDRVAKLDPRIKVFHTENGGPSVARDYGVSKASKDTKYVYFLDCDDVIDKTMLECLYWTLETHKDASFAYTSIVNFGAEEYVWEKYLTIEQEKEENLICVSSMVKKEDLLEVGCFGIKEKAMYEDWNLWLKLIRAGKKPIRVNAQLFWYRRTNSGELSRAKQNNENAMKYVRETASTIKDDQVEVIQYPRYGNNYATTKEYDMVLPDYKKDNRTTILYFFPWMVIGGADYFNLDLLKRLPKDKFRSIILTTTPNNNKLRQSLEEYAEIYDMSSFLDRIDYLSFADYIITSRKIDAVLISNTEYGYYMTPYLKSKHPSIPFMDYIHAIDLRDERGHFGRCTRDVDPYLYKTFACNGFTTKQLKELFNKEAEVVYIGTNEKKFDAKLYDKDKLKDKYGIPKNKKIITFIARLSEEKRPEMFVEIGKRVHAKDPNTFFVIAGDGPLTKAVRLSIDKNFKMLGMIRESEEVYRISDVTVNCSVLEGLALTAYESISMGVPVVSANVGGQAELIDDTVGKIIEFHPNPSKEVFDKEINDYVDSILNVLDNLEKLSSNCREKIVKNFTLDIMAKNMEKIFLDAIKACKNDKVPEITKNSYELACEAFNDLYFKFTNDYYETHLGVWPTADPVPFPKQYRKVMNFLYRIGAYKQGKTIKEFIFAFIKFIKALGVMLYYFVLSIPALIILVWRIIKRIFSKIYHKIVRK